MQNTIEVRLNDDLILVRQYAHTMEISFINEPKCNVHPPTRRNTEHILRTS